MTNSTNTVPSLTPKQSQVVRAKVMAELNDVSQAQAAREVFPNQTPHSAEVSMSQELKKPEVKEALQIALANHGLTVDSVVGVVGDAMQARTFKTDRPDHSIRLKAAGMAARFMGVGENREGTTNYNFINMADNQQGDYGL